jgi:hypothetical protein
MAERQPQLMGVTGDDCASCKSTSVPLYALSCHESDDFHCRDCLTKEFYGAFDEVVRCPHPPCGKPCGFKSLAPLAQSLHLDNDFYDSERIDQIRQQPEVMNSLIAFTADEAEIVLHHVHGLFEDQIINPVVLGGIPGYITADVQNSLEAGFALNPFVCGFLSEMKATRKMMTTPHELDEDLSSLLSNILLQYAQVYYGNDMARLGIDMKDSKAVLAAAMENYKPINEIKDNWEGIIQKWVELLAWRHLERLASPEGGVAERMELRL